MAFIYYELLGIRLREEVTEDEARELKKRLLVPDQKDFVSFALKDGGATAIQASCLTNLEIKIDDKMEGHSPVLDRSNQRGARVSAEVRARRSLVQSRGNVHEPARVKR